ncbi:KR domain-containing protein [Sulfidibacter corallicola]|uniref:KR domain-containing protein n=1 Tax=Sulfidibacter corallicola TaxID=2818388 RepID=A0A8A4TKD8_SULCO|nr:beta-ketoacyl synthase N-terminal-like domain-containing protein [Sulfidibacter corallicola]QTD50043.1 KR domain-containing protein [Sulfidibacter corallicola]
MNQPVEHDTDNHIAVIAMEGRFPGAPDLAAFWDNLRRGVVSLRYRDPSSENADGPSPDAPGSDPSHPTPTGDFVPVIAPLADKYRFDADLFGIPHHEALLMDPQLRTMLELAWAVFEQAGYAPGKVPGRVGVFTASSFSQYFTGSLAAHLAGRSGSDWLQALLGNDKDYFPSQIAYRLDLCGPTLAVQTACSSGLSTVHSAIQSLLSGECDMALAGAVCLSEQADRGYGYQEGGINAADGVVRPFDADADGTVPSQGAGLMLLKPLAQARRDGDRVRGVIVGSAVSNDGAGKAAFYVPGGRGQKQAFREALEFADLPAADLAFIEAMGSGTPAGDAIEAQALTDVIRTETSRTGFCALGSVKANIGHLETASGVAGLFKAILALEHRFLPGNPNFRSPNPELDLAEGPFFVNHDPLPLEAGTRPLYAGVNAYGIGGSNAHLLLEAPPSPPTAESHEAPRLLVLSAATETALAARVTQLADHLNDRGETGLEMAPDDLAFTCQEGRKPLPFRMFTVFESLGGLAAILADRDHPDHAVDHAAGRAEVRFRFGAPLVPSIRGGRELYRRLPGFREIVNHHLALLSRDFDGDPRTASGGRLDPKTLFGDGDEASSLANLLLGHPEVAQPLCFILDWALAQTLIRLGIVPNEAVGQIHGSVTAACVAGVLSSEHALRFLHLHGRAQTAGGSANEAGNHHWQAFLRSIPWRAPEFGLTIGNVQVTADRARDPEFWIATMDRTHPTRDVAAEAGAAPTDLDLDFYAGAVHARTDDDHSEKNHASSPPDRTRPSDGAAFKAFLECLGRCFLLGLPIAWAELHRGQVRRRVPLPSYPFEGKILSVPRTAQAESVPKKAAQVSERLPFHDWFSTPEWVQAPLAKTPREVTPAEPVLVAFGEEKHAHLLCDALALRGATVVRLVAGAGFESPGDGRTAFRVDPDDEDSWRALFDDLSARDLRVSRIFFLDPPGSEGPRPTLDWATRQTKRLVNLARVFSAHPCHLNVVSHGLVDVAGESQRHPDQSLTLGPILVAPLEFPHLTCRAIDLPSGGPGESSWLDHLSQVADESTDSDDALVCYRKGRRLRRIYRAIPALSEPAPAAPTEGRTYLVTGGLGGIGLLMAEALAARPVNLVLTGRTAFPEPDTWTSLRADPETPEPLRARLVRLCALRERGSRVAVFRADSGDLEAMTRVVMEAETRFGEIHGVIHAAGVMAARMLAFRDGFHSAVYAAKVQGTRILGRLFADRRLDFLMLFSSVTALHGYYGLSDYVSANAFQDAYAAELTSRTSFPVMTVNWDAWHGVGMTDRSEPGATNPNPTLAQDRGAVAIRPQEGQAALARLIALHGYTQVCVATTDLNRTRALPPLQVDTLQRLAHLTMQRDTVAERKLDRPYRAPETELETQVAAIWAEVLQVHPVGLDDPFLELGGHSLLALSLTARLVEAFDIELPIRTLFEAPTPALLSAAIENLLLAEIDALSDDQALSLLDH